MRLLGVDLGTKRIGLAVAETSVQLASPRNALAATGTLKRDAEAIHAQLKREEANAIVIGLALGDEGEGSRMAKAARLLAGHLEALGDTVHFVDESLTSVEAENSLLDAGFKASERRRKRDGEAACLILERYMSQEHPNG